MALFLGAPRTLSGSYFQMDVVPVFWVFNWPFAQAWHLRCGGFRELPEVWSCQSPISEESVFISVLMALIELVTSVFLSAIWSPKDLVNYDVFSGAGAIHRTFGLGPNQSKNLQGLVNVQIKRHPTIRDIISKKYLKVMSRIPTKGHIPTPDLSHLIASTMDYDGFEHVHQALFRKLQPFHQGDSNWCQ